MKKTFKLAALAIAATGLIATGLPASANAQATKLSLGLSGWTGYGPLSLADKAGIFEKHGLQVDLRMIPQKDRHLALAAGAIQCAATAVQSHVAWNANGVPIVQIFQMDVSHGADGLAVRNGINSFAELKGKTVAVSAPGTTPYFMLAWMLSKNGMSIKDIKTAMLEPGPASQAFVAGQNDAVASYEPYLSTIRDQPQTGKILATTIDYPMVIDTVGCTPAWLEKNPDAARALADSYFEALEMIAAEPAKSYEIMGAAVKQSGEQFGASAQFLRWQDRAENLQFFADELPGFMKEAAAIMLETGEIRKEPADYAKLYDTRYIQ